MSMDIRVLEGLKRDVYIMWRVIWVAAWQTTYVRTEHE